MSRRWIIRTGWRIGSGAGATLALALALHGAAAPGSAAGNDAAGNDSPTIQGSRPEDFRRALLGDDARVRVDAALVLSTQDLVDVQQLQQLAQELTTFAARRSDPIATSLASSLQCRALYRHSRDAEARSRCDEALQQAKQTDHWRTNLIAERLVAHLRAEGGDPVGAAAMYRDLLARAEVNGDRYAQGALLNTLGVAAENVGAFDEGVRYYAEALEHAQAARSVGLVAMIGVNLGQLQVRMGDFDGAIARLRETLPLADAAGNRMARFVALTAIAEAELGAGRIAQARRELDAILAETDLVADERFQSRLYDIAAQAAIAAGDPARADTLARRGIWHARATPYRRGLAKLTLAQAQLAAGVPNAALATAEEVIAESRAFEGIGIEATRLRADLLAALGRYREAWPLVGDLRERRARQANARAAERLDFIRARFESTLATQALALSQARTAAAEAAAERDRALRNRLVLTLLAVLLGALLLWRLWAQRAAREAKARLEFEVGERTRQLEAQLEQRRALEAELEQKRRLESIGRLTGGIAHDFNNLMTVVRQAADLVKRDARVRDDPKLCGLLDDCASAAMAGAGISRQLVAFARQQPLSPQDWDLQELLLRSRGLLQSSAGEDRELAIEVETPLPAVRVDASQLTTALINLVANARDATQPGARIVIRAGRVALDSSEPHGVLAPGTYVGLSVVDQGCGMNHETWQRAAEPFFTTKQHSGGSGLGLSMVHGFATQSGGGLRIASEEAEGTTATIYLPAAA